MPSVLFRESPPTVDALIDERRRTGIDRVDEVWEGVYVVNPPPSFRHSTIAGLILDLLRPDADARDLVVRREVGIGGTDDYRIPDVVVADPADLDDAGQHLLTAAIAVEVLSPSEHLGKLPFYATRGVTEVIKVDPAGRTVDWYTVAAEGIGYEPVDSSAVVSIVPGDVMALLDT